MESQRKTNKENTRTGDCKIFNEKAFERFTSGTSCLETIASFIEDRTNIEELLSRRFKSLADDLSNILELNPDFEYGAMRELWCEFVSQLLHRAGLHAKVTVSLARENGPLDSLLRYLSPGVHTRMMDLIHRYSEISQSQKFLLSAVKDAKLCFHAHCRHYADLDSDRNAKRRDGETSPRYIQARHKIGRQKSEVARSRDQYLTALLGEEQARPHYLQKMQEIKDEFDQLERERVAQVRTAFLDMLTALDTHGKRDERGQALKTLLEKVKSIDVEQEVEKFNDMFLGEVPDVEFEEYTGQELEDDDDPSSDEDTEEKDKGCAADIHTRHVIALRRDQAVIEAVVASINPENSSRAGLEQDPCMDVNHDNNQAETDVPSYIKKELSDTCLAQKQAPCAESSRADLKLDLPVSPREAFCQDDESEEQMKNSDKEVTSTAKMTNVKVRAISNYRGRRSSELTFKIGQSIKQKSLADATGMAYGWTRKARTGRKKYGYFPVALVELKPSKERKRGKLL